MAKTEAFVTIKFDNELTEDNTVLATAIEMEMEGTPAALAFNGWDNERLPSGDPKTARLHLSGEAAIDPKTITTIATPVAKVTRIEVFADWEAKDDHSEEHPVIPYEITELSIAIGGMAIKTDLREASDAIDHV